MPESVPTQPAADRPPIPSLLLSPDGQRIAVWTTPAVDEWYVVECGTDASGDFGQVDGAELDGWTQILGCYPEEIDRLRADLDQARATVLAVARLLGISHYADGLTEDRIVKTLREVMQSARDLTVERDQARARLAHGLARGQRLKAGSGPTVLAEPPYNPPHNWHPSMAAGSWLAPSATDPDAAEPTFTVAEMTATVFEVATELEQEDDRARMKLRAERDAMSEMLRGMARLVARYRRAESDAREELTQVYEVIGETALADIGESGACKESGCPRPAGPHGVCLGHSCRDSVPDARIVCRLVSGHDGLWHDSGACCWHVDDGTSATDPQLQASSNLLQPLGQAQPSDTCWACGKPGIQYQPFSGGREYFCPTCEDTFPYREGQAPRRAQMIRDGRFGELKAEMAEHLAAAAGPVPVGGPATPREIGEKHDVYVRIEDSEVATTDVIGDIHVDRAANGDPLGVEVLGATGVEIDGAPADQHTADSLRPAAPATTDSRPRAWREGDAVLWYDEDGTERKATVLRAPLVTIKDSASGVVVEAWHDDLADPEPVRGEPGLTALRADVRGESSTNWAGMYEAARAQREGFREDLEAAQHLLGCIWLYVDWRYVTKKLTTEQKEMWADAVDVFGDPADRAPKAERWWRDDAPQASSTPTPEEN